MLRTIEYAVVLVCFAGCGKSDSQRVPVQGTVTYEGKPVTWGSIALRPARDTKGPAAGTDIVDGKYEIPASAGPATGAYTARITTVESSETGTTPGPIVKGPGNMKSLEVQIEIEADRGEYDIHLPAAADSRIQR